MHLDLQQMKNASLAAAAAFFGILLIISFDFLFSRYLISDPDVPVPLDSSPHVERQSGWYELKTHFAGQDSWGGKLFAVVTDSHGFRVAHPDASAAPAKVIFLGDSYTYGINGSWDETFVGMYASHAAEPIINAGVPSYSPTPYLHQYRKALASGRLDKPHTVVVALDISDVQDEATRWKEGPQHPVAMTDQRPPTHEPSLRKYVAARMLLTKTVYRYLKYSPDDVPDELIFDLARSGLTWQKPEQLEAQYGPLGVRTGLAKTAAVLTQIGELARAHGGRYYLLIYPWPAQLKYESSSFDWARFAADVCARSACAGVVNTFPRFQELAAKDPNWYRKYYVAGDTHFNTTGNRIIFEELVRQLPKP